MNNLFSNLKSLSSPYNLNNGLKQLTIFNYGLNGIQSKRNTYILKRRFPVKLNKKGLPDHVFRSKNYAYDLVENTENKKQPLVQVLLTKYVEGVGRAGELVTVKRSVAYNKLLLPGLADYATPEAIEKAKEEAKNIKKEDVAVSSQFAPLMVKYLETQVLSVVMNKDVEWTIKPWHVRVSFRKAGIIVPEDCIELPPKPIKGPNLDLENKDFLVTVTINNLEKAHVRCRIHHFSTDPAEKLPYVKYPWLKESVPIFEEDAMIIKKLPPPIFDTGAATTI